MKYLKMLGLLAMAALGLSVFAGSAFATTTATKGVVTNAAETMELSIPSGSSVLLKDTNGLLVDTCKESSVKFTTTSPFTGASVAGPVSSMSFNGCSHKTVVLKNGSLSFTWTSGTNATVRSSGTELTVESTIFGTDCIAKSGEGIDIGTYTGVKEGNGLFEVNGVMPMGICGDVNLSGGYKMTTANVGFES